MKKTIVPFIIIIFIVFSANPLLFMTVNVNWSENFDPPNSLDNWLLTGYSRISPLGLQGTITSSIPSGFTIQDGILISSFNYFDNSGNGNISYAWHNSTVNYGTWSFDVFIDNWTINKQDLEVNFLFYHSDQNYNFSGQTFNQVYAISGFGLVITGQISNTYSIEFWRDVSKLSIYQPNNSIYNSFHNFKITRDLTGEFKIFMDNNLIITKVDNSSVSSQKFGIGSVYGTNKIDNISILSLPSTSSTSSSLPTSTSSTSKNTPDFEWYIVISLLIITILPRRFVKLRK